MMTCLPGFVGLPRGVNGLRLLACLLQQKPEERRIGLKRRQLPTVLLAPGTTCLIRPLLSALLGFQMSDWLACFKLSILR